MANVKKIGILDVDFSFLYGLRRACQPDIWSRMKDITSFSLVHSEGYGRWTTKERKSGESYFRMAYRIIVVFPFLCFSLLEYAYIHVPT